MEKPQWERDQNMKKYYETAPGPYDSDGGNGYEQAVNRPGPYDDDDEQQAVNRPGPQDSDPPDQQKEN